MNGREFEIGVASAGLDSWTGGSIRRGKGSNFVEFDTAAGTVMWQPQADGTAMIARLPASKLVGVVSDGTIVDETTDRSTNTTRLAFWTRTGEPAGVISLEFPLGWVAWDVAVLLNPGGPTQQIDLRADHRGEVLGEIGYGDTVDRPVRPRRSPAIHPVRGSP